MPRRHTRAVTAVLTGLALLALTATPAAATTVDLTITDGLLQVFGPFEVTPYVVTPLDGTSCTSAPTLTATDLTPTTGTITITLFKVFEVLNPFGNSQDYLMTRTTTLTGTYTNATFALTGTSSQLIEELTDSCTGDTPICTMTAINLSGSGTLTSGTFPTLTSGDTLSITGGNTDFETVVFGSGCSGFSAVDSGRVEFYADLEVV